MPETLFHTAVSRWFSTEFRQPTEIQQRAWPEIQKQRNTLIAAPTGSGKTLAAFLATIDTLVRQGLNGGLEDSCQVVYVSPLKALSNDIERNLQAPLAGIRQELARTGLPPVDIRVALRTGDTPPSQRAAMVKKPPHILVSTPESLYILLTSESGRNMLSGVHTVIVDEIHALVGSKRGSHLALSLERLEALGKRRPVRIGLSATQKPIESVAEFLTGGPSGTDGAAGCSVIDTGHRRAMELRIEVPQSPLSAVMPNEVWGEVYARIVELIETHTTTLIFVNTRRLAERMAHHLSERMGPNLVMAHHGSMARERRLDAEQRLKAGTLRALVATASLELGIDIGSVDLVCQIGAPRSIATLLQRVGRSGHSVDGIPKGIVFPLTRDELVDCSAALDAIRRGELDRVIIPEKPLDILAQHIVAEVAGSDWNEDELFTTFRKAWPYRNLERGEFDEVVAMLAEGYATRNGRRGAYLHHDMVNRRLKARRGARLSAFTSGGAIPDNFDVDVVLDPSGVKVGTLNEDFAIESMPGDIFNLGNSAWKITKVENGKVRVEDAKGQPPSMPFWLGEAPGRSAELSRAVARLRREVAERLGNLSALRHSAEYGTEARDESWKQQAMAWLRDAIGLDPAAADQLVMYIASVQAAFGCIPSERRLVMERFFDEAGDMHVVIHSPFGSRINRAWGLALRKRFCRKFNFELQAAASEDAIILSLGSTHSFPLDEVFHYLNPQSVRHVLIQAVLDSPMFEVRWRWNASRALAVLRTRGGKRVPPQIQRMNAEDLIALVFPDQLACLENIAGEREVPQHPLVEQTIRDCLYEAMDIEGLERLLDDLHAGRITTLARDLREPSPMAQEIINARPYAFLDDAALEERRTRAIAQRRWLDPAEAADLGRLDPLAIAAVKREAWPQARNPDELHDALVLHAFLSAEEGRIGPAAEYSPDETTLHGTAAGNGAQRAEQDWRSMFALLRAAGRATELHLPGAAEPLWVAVERLPQFTAVFPQAVCKPPLQVPERIASVSRTPEEALREIVRGRLELLGPVRAAELAHALTLPAAAIDQALLALENEGFVFRGQYLHNQEGGEWCERRLLARIHRYTLQKLRSEIEAVSAADYMRYLFALHRMSAEERAEGPGALQKALHMLEGFEATAAAWESDLLTMRVADYDYLWLDVLCMSGRIVWGRMRPPGGESSPGGPIKTTPIMLVSRENVHLWMQQMRGAGDYRLSPSAQKVYNSMCTAGASFFDQLQKASALLPTQVEDAIGELVALGLITADSFTGLRALLTPARYRESRNGSARRKRSQGRFVLGDAGRWSLLQEQLREGEAPDAETECGVETIARILLRRYGVVFRRVLERENAAPPWRDLLRVYRLLEARGEIRGGHFVDGMWGEQFALPEAIPQLRAIRKAATAGELISISAADPLNLQGIITPGARIPVHSGNRILYRDGIPIAVLESGATRFLVDTDAAEEWKWKSALLQQNLPPTLKTYLGRGIG